MSFKALGAAAIPLIGVFVAAMILIAVAIELSKDSPLQDWLERCAWGRLTQQRYKSAEEANKELKIAMDAA